MCNTIGDIFRLCILGGVALGLTMQFFVTFNCSFLETPSGDVGIWFVDDGTGECVEWESTDEFIKGAQSALSISTAAGFCAGVLVLFEWLLCEVCCAGCIEGLAFLAAWAVGGSVFMIYAIEDCGDGSSLVDGEIPSGDSCGWGADASFMTTACAAYLICSFLLCCAPQPDPLCKR